MRAFAGLPTVTVEDDDKVALALDWMDSGMDFANALHLAKADVCDGVVSFDRNFVRAAKRPGAVKASVL